MAKKWEGGGQGPPVAKWNVIWDVKGCIRYIFSSLFLKAKESACETRKNLFYYTSKALFILEIIKF